MEGSFGEKNENRMFLLGAGLLGLILIASLSWSQLAYDSYAQASAKNRQLQARMDEFLVIRGKANDVAEALTDRSITFANPALAIDQRVWNLQMAWEDFLEETQNPWSGTRFLMPSAAAVDAVIDQFALSALRNSSAIAKLEPQLSAMQREISDSIDSAAAKRDSAMAGIAYGRSIAYGSFFALATLLVGRILISGARCFKESLSRAPVPTIASPQR